MNTNLPLLTELLSRNGLLGPKTLALRHSPKEQRLKRSFSDLIVRRHDLFNAYQSMQEGRADIMLSRAERVIAFLGDAAGRATLIGVYDVCGRQSMDSLTYWSNPLNTELRTLGMVGPGDRSSIIAFHDLRLTSQLADLRGRLIVEWPGKEVSWTQWLDEREDRFRMIAIEGVSRFEAPPVPWRSLCLTWTDLALLSPALRQLLGQWRGVYFIYDVDRRAGYVGSAGGAENLLGRWTHYGKTGHGGNKGLLGSDPLNLRFSILERTSPDLPIEELISLETSWKERLHTRAPSGLNGN